MVMFLIRIRRERCHLTVGVRHLLVISQRPAGDGSHVCSGISQCIDCALSFSMVATQMKAVRAIDYFIQNSIRIDEMLSPTVLRCKTIFRIVILCSVWGHSVSTLICFIRY